MKLVLIVNDAPMITHGCGKTDRADGEIIVRWVDPPEIDSTIVLSLSSYKLYRSTLESGGYQLVTAVPFYGDHEVLDVGLNTQDYKYFYKIEFWGRKQWTPSPLKPRIRHHRTSFLLCLQIVNQTQLDSPGTLARSVLYDLSL